MLRDVSYFVNLANLMNKKWFSEGAQPLDT